MYSIEVGIVIFIPRHVIHPTKTSVNSCLTSSLALQNTKTHSSTHGFTDCKSKVTCSCCQSLLLQPLDNFLLLLKNC